MRELLGLPTDGKIRPLLATALGDYLVLGVLAVLLVLLAFEILNDRRRWP